MYEILLGPQLLLIPISPLNLELTGTSKGPRQAKTDDANRPQLLLIPIPPLNLELTLNIRGTLPG